MEADPRDFKVENVLWKIDKSKIKNKVDLLKEVDNKLIPIEIKNTYRPFRPVEYRGILNFMEKYGSKSQLGFIIYQGKAEEIKIKKSVIRMLPAWYVLPLL